MDAACLRLALLEWAAGRTAAGQLDIDVRAWPMLADTESGQVFDLVQELVVAGLVSCSAGQHQLRLTAEGVTHIEQVRARRSDLQFRRSQARNAVLRWLYDQPGQRGLGLRSYYDLSFFRRDRRSYLDCVQLSDREIREAYDDLRELGLAREAGWTIIGVTSSIQHPTATTDGKLCVEGWAGNVAAYVDHRRVAASAPTYNINNSTAVIDSKHFTQDNRVPTSTPPRASSAQEQLYTRLLADSTATMSTRTKGYPSDWDDDARTESYETAKRRSELIAEAEALASATVYELWLQAVEADQEVIDLSSNLPWSPDAVAEEIGRSPEGQRRNQAREALRAQVRLELGRDPLVCRADPEDSQ
ncbi:hypothetical protein ACIPYS_26460 [Kitasatospora sp. NPDC089913]|uniref:hypothetical protein n=1 Tax=Kitasatospora sp. NPDC089913 TaxID=3364080 RepID=UPI003815C8E9